MDYKVLGADGQPFHGGTGVWSLPSPAGPGAWMPRIEGMLRPCSRGYHLLRREQVIPWLGPTLWRAETDDPAPIVCEDKIVVRSARLLSLVESWNGRTARLFACDCADRALDRERAAGRPPHPDSIQAVAVARRYATGDATMEQLIAAEDAAWAAARAAARDAAWAARDAAWAAARAATEAAACVAAEAAACVAVEGAAKAAAWDAAKAAAWADAWADERRWQTEHLFAMLGEPAE